MIALALVTLMIVWGGAFISIKYSLRYINSFELLLARFIPSAILIIPVAYWLKGRNASLFGFWKGLSRRGKIAVLVCAFLATPGYNYFLNLGETIIPAGWAAVVIALNPASIAIFAAFLLGERLSVKRVMGLIIAFISIFYIGVSNEVVDKTGVELTTWMKISGVVITMGAVVCWGLYVSISKRLMRHKDPLVLLAWVLVLGTLMMLPGLRIELWHKLIEAPPILWFAVFYISVICTVIGFAVWQWAVSHWTASRTGSFIYIVPVSALFQGWLLLGESLSLSILLGVGGVIAGVALAGKK